MIKKHLQEIIEELKSGKIDSESGYKKLYNLISGNLGFAEVDMARAVRKGFPEVVFCKNKEDEDVIEIAARLTESGQPVLLTRANPNIYQLLTARLQKVKYYERSRIITIGQPEQQLGAVTVISAGTSDIPVAEEAAVTASIMGAAVKTFWDIGVAGIHRLFSKLEHLQQSRVVVVAAGMDGALPGVVAGLVSCPVVAVPTSVGYGTGAGGYAALMTMLNSCSPGVTVVNIDNGFGAGYAAALINRLGAPDVAD